RAIRPIFERPGEPPNGAVPLRLRGRYGRDASVLLDGATPDELEPIGSTPFLWAELRWAARHELVEHLDDLLLRRTRIGLLLTNGGERYLDRIGALCREELGWSDGRWALELDDYRQRWRNHYGVPHG
ncbi:MAG TPA: glycerol-3-phosphate dehydrogenase C-terminal domain-containing protein, partial [Candidatus Baltobacteraceae bacterium]|nr:glycerol-3-phosphate dehydrogenase C-terminal domain-containing protein [Candidatus Baltobacteraceae bacterium]